ncbi:ABC transporter permease [Brooklawnia cerclae]|uniref:Autoinducer 2 import system permease protein LsrD n=1 Tax=Brooklawnia cerclae TaxID=349934 RepID=A0ABX0SCB1_9ACTN|nr:ABC transporter permease [Brooklawnia cerclae]NIH56028.1 ribose transport system permease protein [Brooklawnia cerclae]
MSATTATPVTDGQGSGTPARPRLTLVQIAPHAIFLLVVIVTFVFAPGYRSAHQIASLLQLMALLGVVAIGQNLAILIGGIDLSVGAVMTLTNLVTALVMAGTDATMPVAIGLTLAIGLVVGLFNGLGVALLKIPDMVMTLATMTILLGVSYLVTGGVNKGNASPAIIAFITHRFAGVLTGGVILWLVLGVAIVLVLRKTVFGMQLYAVGLRRRAAQASGVRVWLVIVAIYVVSGLMASLGGLMLTGYVGSSYYNLGDPYVMSSIAAVVIGGTSIFGGVGGYGGTFSGVGTIVVLLSFLQVVGLPEAGQQIAYGVVLLLMLILFVRQQKRA